MTAQQPGRGDLAVRCASAAIATLAGHAAWGDWWSSLWIEERDEITGQLQAAILDQIRADTARQAAATPGATPGASVGDETPVLASGGHPAKSISSTGHTQPLSVYLATRQINPPTPQELADAHRELAVTPPPPGTLDPVKACALEAAAHWHIGGGSDYEPADVVRAAEAFERYLRGEV